MGQTDRMRFFSVSVRDRGRSSRISPSDGYPLIDSCGGTLAYQGTRLVYLFHLSIPESKITERAELTSKLPGADPDDSAIKILTLYYQKIALPPYLELDGPCAITELADPAFVRGFREELGIEYVPHTA